MFKSSLSICYTFFVIDDGIVTSLDTCMSTMRICTKYTWSNLCQKI